MNETLNVRLQVESWNSWKSPLIQEKHPYKSSTIKYSSINARTSENVLWSNSSIQMWSTSKDWKTVYVLKTGSTEIFSKIREAPVSASTIKDQKPIYGILLDLWKLSSEIRENFVNNPQLNMI